MGLSVSVKLLPSEPLSEMDGKVTPSGWSHILKCLTAERSRVGIACQNLLLTWCLPFALLFLAFLLLSLWKDASASVFPIRFVDSIGGSRYSLSRVIKVYEWKVFFLWVLEAGSKSGWWRWLLSVE